MTKKSIATVVGFSCVFLAVAINGALSANQEKSQPKKAKVQLPIVSVTKTVESTHQATVSAFGEVKPRNQLTLTSQVSGKIIELSPTFLTGRHVKKGEVLARIEPITYQQSLANAEATLANASLALAQEELSSEQAAQEWEQSGLSQEQASDLVLRKPQLAVAKANYEVANLALEKAKYDLAQTRIVAPFDAVITSRNVQTGSNVQASSLIAELYDTRLFEVSLSLSAQQWKLLPKQVKQLVNMQVLLTDESGDNQWHATIDRVEQHVNDQSRQRALVVAVKDPIGLSTPLYPGSFVKASITGQAIDKLWRLPASALIDSNNVWQVNNDGLLSYLPVTVMFSQGNNIYVQPLHNLAKASIVKRPLASYLANMKVQPVAESLAVKDSSTTEAQINAVKTVAVNHSNRAAQSTGAM